MVLNNDTFAGASTMRDNQILGGGIAAAGGATPWAGACSGAAFVTLRSQRVRLVRVLTAIYLVCYLGLAVLCGFFRGAAGSKILGPLNLGYLLILGNYALAWTLALVYLRRSGKRHDVLAAAALEDHSARLTADAALAP